MARILSGKTDRVVGRPSPARWSARTRSISNTAKASVRRLFRNDPAKGILQPGGDKITTTHIDLNGPQTPNKLRRDKSPAVNKNKTLVKNRGINRSVQKR